MAIVGEIVFLKKDFLNKEVIPLLDDITYQIIDSCGPKPEPRRKGAKRKFLLDEYHGGNADIFETNTETTAAGVLLALASEQF
jgi:hypothetical protein